jgi:hypothetical protein
VSLCSFTEPRLGCLRPEESCRGRLRRETLVSSVPGRRGPSLQASANTSKGKEVTEGNLGFPLFQGGEARAFRRAPP